jgi:hypothetical protein
MVTWAAKKAGPRAECWAILMVQHWGLWDYLMDVLMVWTLAVWLGHHWAEASATYHHHHHQQHLRKTMAEKLGELAIHVAPAIG